MYHHGDQQLLELNAHLRDENGEEIHGSLGYDRAKKR